MQMPWQMGPLAFVMGSGHIIGAEPRLDTRWTPPIPVPIPRVAQVKPLPSSHKARSRVVVADAVDVDPRQLVLVAPSVPLSKVVKKNVKQLSWKIVDEGKRSLALLFWKRLAEEAGDLSRLGRNLNEAHDEKAWCKIIADTFADKSTASLAQRSGFWTHDDVSELAAQSGRWTLVVVPYIRGATLQLP